ncbi:MAG TPA: hypothetical protein VGH82_07910 [Gaiellaceae bacterium]
MSTVSATAASEARLRAPERARVAVAVGTCLAGLTVLAVVAARHAAPSEVSPVIPRDEWNDIWVASLVASFVLYGLGTYLAWSGAMRLRVAVIVAVFVQAVPLGAPLLLSKDAYLYWGEARVFAVHHANPYVATPAQYPTDPATPWVSESWRSQATPYGPAWTLAAAPVAATSSRLVAELAYRAIALVALLGCLLVIARRTRSAAAVAFLGWSPLLALHYAGGGHSDALMMLATVGAIALGTSSFAGGALWPVASAFKPFPPVLVPLELARRRLAVGSRWWAGIVVSTIAMIAIATGLFGTHWIRQATTGAHQSSPLGGVHWLTEAGLTHRVAVVVAALVFVAVYVVLLRNAWRTGRGRFSLAATALCLTSSLLRPWYAIWPVALAALEEDALAAVAAFALSAYLLFGDAVHF